MLMFYGTFITWTDAETTILLNNIKNIFADLSPLLIPIIAIGIGLIVIGAIIRAVRG